MQKPRYPRTLVASLLALIAVAVPSTAWYFAGQRQVERQAESNCKVMESKGYKTASRLAEELSLGLELLADAESRRSIFHYQNLYHEPKGAADGVMVLPSPLAQGPEDPLVEAYFQVDGDGTLSLPTLNDAFPELGLAGAQDSQCELLWKLQDVALFCHLETGRVAGGTRLTDLGEPEVVGDSGFDFDVRLLELQASAWRQHLQANDVWARLKYGEDGDTPGVVISGRPLAGLDLASGSHETVNLEVHPFRWHTLPMGSEPALVALRRVTTPAGEWTQGFVVSANGIDRHLENSYFPARFEPSVPSGKERQGKEDAHRIRSLVEGTGWRVSVDLTRAVESILESAETEGEEFRRSFFLGSFAAGVAALLIVGLVFQSERLAQQRIQFAAHAAHELRTPLAGLRIYGEMLAEGLGDPDRGRDYARRVAAEAERLGRVVTNVLSFTRLERGNIGLHPEPGDLRSAVLEAFQRQRPALEESGAELVLELEDRIPIVSFDRDAVGHILQNLLDNAEKYTRGVPDRRIVVRLTDEGKAAVLTVVDNGDGIPGRLRRRLFVPFARGGEADQPEGLGLGLVLVRMLVQDQGASIEYRDAPGGGAMFQVAFPISAEPAGAPATAEA
ncbi:MAG: HAMP domain-containing histidine kinase [Thermoanaerobaculia bacterium]|nr:HAMP domain-containing histidine kinase [Thermoanaerobaculia bacterium]